ncbi:MAG: YCF48-related protein [bacterium]
MKKYTLYVIFFLFLSLSMYGQIFQGPASGSVPSGVTVNTGSFTEEQVPVPGFKPKPIKNLFTVMKLPDLENNILPTGTEGSNYVEDPLINNTDKVTSGDFILTKNFQGVQDQGMYIPPDPYLAVGPNHIVAVVNSRFRILDKSGVVQKTIEGSSWYQSTLANSDPFDPKVIFDHYSNRWVMVWLNVGTSSSYFLISVSDDADPNGVWYNWKLPSNYNGSTSAGNWSDYQGVGYDQNAIYITSNQFSFAGSFNYAKIRIISKTDLYAATPGVINFKDLWDIKTPSPNTNVFGLRPTRNYDNSGEYYLVNNSPYVTGTYFVVYRLTNPLTSPSLTAVTVPVTAYTDPQDASQLGSSYTIDGGSSNLRNEPIVRNGTLHLVHSVKSGTSGLYSSVRYCAINLATNTATSDISMGSDTYFHSYPAVAVDNNNNVAITYSRSATTEYAGAFFTTKPATSNTLTGSKPLKTGNGYYYKTFGGDRNRWGDYNGAWVDPSVDGKIYLLTEYVSSANTWGSWIGELTFTTATTSVTVSAPDGGEHWVVGSAQNITWVSQNVTNVKIEISTDNGTNWSTIVNSVPAAPASYSYTVPNTPSGLCVVRISDVSNASLYDVSNGTFTIGTQTSAYDWEVVTCPVTTDLSAISIVNANISWIAGDGGVVLKSIDGGTTWTKCTNVTGNVDLYAISGYDENKVIVGDGSGNIFRSTDGGTTWTKVSTNAGSFIDVVDYVNSELAYAIGDPTSSVWRLLKSTDGGATWALATSLAAASGEAGWNCAYERVGSSVWFGTNKTKVYKSTTGLEGPWTSGTTSTYTNSYGMAFSDAYKGIVVVNDGTNGKVMRTIDGGANWTATNYPITALSNLADYIEGTGYCWVGTFSNGILHSTDYGTTWIVDRLPGSVAGVNALKVYPDAQNGIAVGPAGLILKSTMTSVVPVELTSFTASATGSYVNLAWKTATENNNSGFEVQRKTNELEIEWTTLGFKPGAGNSTSPIYYYYSDDLSGLSSTYAIYRLKQVDYDGSVNYSNEIKVENVLPTEFSLEQNYPNPFNPSTKINFTLPYNSNVKLEIYSINGEKVATLINEIRSAGFHSYELNTENLTNKVLSSGIYIYRLTSANLTSGVVFSQARKMMLLK